jgi:hypothetical protein
VRVAGSNPVFRSIHPSIVPGQKRFSTPRPSLETPLLGRFSGGAIGSEALELGDATAGV